MEHVKWKTYIIIAFIDLLSVYLAVARVAYLTDIFEELNDLNLSMQGKQNSILS